MSKFTQAEERLFISVIQDCALHGIDFMLINAKRVVVPGETEGQGCNGYFSSGMGTLAVAIDKPVSEWTRVLLHEYNHLRQWIEDPEGCDEADVDTRFLWQWIDNKCELNHAMVIRVCSIAIEVELDCERRTVKMAEELGFNWDLKEYIRGANAYLYFYPVISKTGKWYTEAPYRVHEITSIMPAYFLADAETYFDIPEEVEQLIREKCMTPEEEIDG